MKQFDMKTGSPARRLHNLIAFTKEIGCPLATRLLGDGDESVLIEAAFTYPETLEVITAEGTWVAKPGQSVHYSHLWTMGHSPEMSAVSEYERERLGWDHRRAVCVECLTCGCTCPTHTGGH